MRILEPIGPEGEDPFDIVDKELMDLYAEMSSVQEWDLNKSMNYVRLSYIKGISDATESISQALSNEDNSSSDHKL